MDGRQFEHLERGLMKRMNQVRGSTTIRRLALRVGVHPETARRYLDTGRVPAAVVAAISRAFGVNGNWLLTGVGCPDPADEAKRILESISTQELLSEVGKRMDRVVEPKSSPAQQAEPGTPLTLVARNGHHPGGPALPANVQPGAITHPLNLNQNGQATR
jgi:hypothetical protein